MTNTKQDAVEVLTQNIQSHMGLKDEEFNQTLEDVASYGASTGSVNFTTYTQYVFIHTVEFYDNNASLIWELAEEKADAMGMDSVMEFIDSFQISEQIHNPTTFKNAMSWFALEEVAHYNNPNI